MDAVILAILIHAGSAQSEEAKTCDSIIQAVEVSRFRLGYTKEQTIKSFEEWAARVNMDTSSLTLPWYRPAVLALIDSGFEAKDVQAWRDEAMRACLSIAGGNT